ncbi:MAG: VacJ family lipoprotein [Gammaproteobacteria bacterium]|nr:VacJ family lipoprotein [Gammaproteobacteria bacterium]
MKRTFFLIGVLLLPGCATLENNYDPIESVNRGIYRFNRVFDKTLARPIAKGYDTITPKPVKTRITYFYFNLGGLKTTVHDFLQGKFKRSGVDAGRFIVNSTVGILGLFDVATKLGLEKNQEDFGQTIGVWGIQNPPFLIMPFLGPSNFVDAPGFLLDSFLGPYPYLETTTRNILFALDITKTRADLLTVDKMIDEQIDPYLFIRNAYQQKRRSAIADGKGDPQEDKELEQELEQLKQEVGS